MGELGRCEHPQCDEEATRAVQVADMIRAVVCCEKHASDFRECGSVGCQRLAQIVVTIGAYDRPPAGGPRELWLCSQCAESARRAPTVTLGGRRFVNNRAGWLIPLPPNVGRG